MPSCPAPDKRLGWEEEAVNTQVRTHAQIHIHTQIPAYVQLPALFQPCVLLQPSAHLHHNQAPSPAKIPIDPLVLAKTLILTCRPCITSVDTVTHKTELMFGTFGLFIE